MKYIDADLLRKEVKRLEKAAHKAALGCVDSETRKIHEGKDFAYQHVGVLIDSLQAEEKETPKDIDEMIDDHFKSLFPNIAYYRWRVGDVYVHASPDGIRNLCNHFYELGKNSK